MQNGCPAGSAKTQSGSSSSAGPILQRGGSKGEGSPVLELEGLDVWDLEVQVELLRDGAFRPGRRREGSHLLEARCEETQNGVGPPATRWPLYQAGRLCRWFVARSVDVAEQLSVDSCEPPRVGGVEHYLAQNRERTVIFRRHTPLIVALGHPVG